MTKTAFRLLLAILFVSVVIALYLVHFATLEFPEMAVLYIQWWRSQPLSTLQQLALQYGTPIHVAWLLSLVGLALLWSPARYVFLLCVAVVIFREALSSAPVVTPSEFVVLDNIIAVLSGMVLLAMYSKPLNAMFVVNPFKR